MTRNLFADIPSALPDELLSTLLDSTHCRIERIVSYGQVSPPDFWYDQNQREWVILLKGAAKLRFENESRALEMRPGDYVSIPAHQKHRVEWTTSEEATIWLAIHYGAPKILE